MRSMMVATCIAGLFVFASAANAEPSHDLGGPVRSGAMCWTGTDGLGGVYGYWAKCPPAAHMKMAKTKKMKG